MRQPLGPRFVSGRNCSRMRSLSSIAHCTARTRMRDYQQDFIELALDHEVLRFGQFTLKSGRDSPYFFNLGQISSGVGLRALASAYADALLHSNIEIDMLFGPAYKGIPLVAALATEMASRGYDLPWAYNRKEAKDHGEGGLLVGAKPHGRVLIIDDVLTVGTAMREAMSLLKQAGAQPVAALVALDRREKGPEGRSAVEEISRETGLQVISLVTVQDVMVFLRQRPEFASTLEAMQAYLERFGVD